MGTDFLSNQKTLATLQDERITLLIMRNRWNETGGMTDAVSLLDLVEEKLAIKVAELKNEVKDG
jgi:hypothetical protein